LTGQVLLSEQANSKTYRLNTKNLADDVYFVKAYRGSKQVVLKKRGIQKIDRLLFLKSLSYLVKGFFCFIMF
jgi:hypothetical protein